MHNDGEEGVTQTLMGGLKIYLKVHLITRRLHSLRWSCKEFQIKSLNEKTQVQLCKHLLTRNINSLKNIVSAAQRDQMFLNLARDELKIKEAMVASLGESATQTEKLWTRLRNSSLRSTRRLVMVWR